MVFAMRSFLMWIVRCYCCRMAHMRRRHFTMLWLALTKITAAVVVRDLSDYSVIDVSIVDVGHVDVGHGAVVLECAAFPSPASKA